VVPAIRLIALNDSNHNSSSLRGGLIRAIFPETVQIVLVVLEPLGSTICESISLPADLLPHCYLVYLSWDRRSDAGTLSIGPSDILDDDTHRFRSHSFR
jgi:hypothetical protein